MKKVMAVCSICILGIATLVYAIAPKAKVDQPYLLQDGDLVFQEGYHLQGRAIKAATDSRWTHIGIVFHKDGNPFILEAVQPVKVTSLADFVKRDSQSFYAMRLKNSEVVMTKKALSQARQYGLSQIGKNYDSKFLWSDDRIYCSELVWKIYKKGLGVELCKTRQFRSYNLKHPTVQKIIKQRYRSFGFLPLDELVVAPSDIAQSSLLVEVPKKK